MIVKAIVHEEESGGYWAEIPALPGCATQGETMDDLLVNLREAVEGYSLAEIESLVYDDRARTMEIKLSALRTSDYFSERAARGDVAEALRLMGRPGGEPPRPGDEIPPEYIRVP